MTVKIALNGEFDLKGFQFKKAGKPGGAAGELTNVLDLDMKWDLVAPTSLASTGSKGAAKTDSFFVEIRRESGDASDFLAPALAWWVVFPMQILMFEGNGTTAANLRSIWRIERASIVSVTNEDDDEESSQTIVLQCSHVQCHVDDGHKDLFGEQPLTVPGFPEARNSHT